MCGIIGYIGPKNAVPVLLEGLQKLEYRGYDSAGIAFLQENTLVVRKAQGALDQLVQVISAQDHATIGIGHTRWATHGAPSTRNAHPHLSMNEKIAVIHNGIIENYVKIKGWLEREKKIQFSSETDSEVIAHLIACHYEEVPDLLQAVKMAVDQMEGAYAISVIARDRPEELVAVRKDSPLIIGLGEGENFLASDVPAILKYTRDVLYVENDEFVRLRADGVTLYDSFLQEVNREVVHVEWDVESAEKEGYEHFTLKEIHEQPRGLKDTIFRRIDEAEELQMDFQMDSLEIERIRIVACGTAYHAGLVGKHLLQELTRLPVEVDVASEFRYNRQFLDEKTLCIAISQSGETIDTLQAVRKAKESGAVVWSILNVVGSSIARESDEVFFTWAGPEIGVASTKAYTTQLAALALIAILLGYERKTLSEAEGKRLIQELKKLPEKVEETLLSENLMKHLAYDQFHNDKVFFIGRGVDFYTALEASLKLKEISYINSFAIAAGELKHGTIALVEEETLVIVFLTQCELKEKTFSNIKEVKARGARVLLITSMKEEVPADLAEDVIAIPNLDPLFLPILSIIPGQLLAYYISLARGNDVDKPRNLAKSVTVE